MLPRDVLAAKLAVTIFQVLVTLLSALMAFPDNSSFCLRKAVDRANILSGNCLSHSKKSDHFLSHGSEYSFLYALSVMTAIVYHSPQLRFPLESSRPPPPIW